MLDTAQDHRVLLEPCSWETYERILAEHADRGSPRFTYSEGVLEIMSPSPEHEELSETLKLIVSAACEELKLAMRPLGSSTMRRVALQRGVEPDSSYFFGDVRRNPLTAPPDLMIEVEISSSALDKLVIFARLGVPEVWRCGRQGVRILRLKEGEYEEAERSAFLPLTAAGLSAQLARWDAEKHGEWLAGVRAWIRQSMR